MPNQVSLFAENKKGALHAITAVLADANININTMLTNDSAEYGIVRLIVDRPEEAIAVIKTSEPEAEAFLRGRGYQIADQF